MMKNIGFKYLGQIQPLSLIQLYWPDLSIEFYFSHNTKHSN